MEMIFSGISGLQVFYDDFRILSKSAELHLTRIRDFLQCCREKDIRLHSDKCETLKNRITYLRYEIDEFGVHKKTKKVDAIPYAPSPRDRTAVKSFCELVNYYGRFILNLNTILYPINNLLQKNTTFTWSKDYHKAFQKV